MSRRPDQVRNYKKCKTIVDTLHQRNMKKTLLVCGHYPSPENVGTTIRTMNFVRFFQNLGSVDIVYSTILPGGKTGNPLFLNEYYLEKKAEQSIRERFMRWINIRKRPLPISRYSENSEKQLLSLMERNNYDYILVRYVINTWSPFQSAVEHQKRTIIDFDDILSGSLCESDIASANGWGRKARLRLNQKYLRDYEKKCLNFGAALFCSKKDKLKIMAGENGRNNIFVVPNIYYNRTSEDHDFGNGFERDNSLLFVGALNYGPNIQGLKWFIDSIFPEFKRSYPDATLSVVGRFPAQEVKKLSERIAGIRLYADVPDMRWYYERCRAVVVPLLAGGGTRIKILEAALANRPVLSTPIGAEGLDFVDGINLLLFDNAQDFSLQYRKLLDREKYNSLISNAKHLVSTKYSTQMFNDVMEKVLNKIDHKKHNTFTNKIQK